MHSTVFELSERPVPAGRWITPGYLPDWFFSGADYAERMSCAEREGSIAALVDCLGGDCIRQGDCLTFAPVLSGALPLFPCRRTDVSHCGV